MPNELHNEKALNITQRRWLELVKDYDCEIHYHRGKASIVTYTLSRKTIGNIYLDEII